jgi:hypothetical protein
MSTPLPAGQLFRQVTVFMPVDDIEPPTPSLDEHAADIKQILDTDRILDELRDGFAERVSHADHLFAQIKAALRMPFDGTATNDEIAAQAVSALTVAWQRHDAVERLARVEAALKRVYFDRPPEDEVSAADVAGEVASAIHPLSSPVESVTAMLAPVKPSPTPRHEAGEETAS